MRTVRMAVTVALAAGLLLGSAPAQSQVPAATAIQFAFSGVADVSPGIFFPEIDPTNNTSWTWSFRSTAACQGSGTSNGTPGAGACNLSAGGPLLKDLFAKPACGNSAGRSTSASFQDPTGRIWTGEVHWDGVATGDHSYSLGSQLVLHGTMSSSGAGSVQIDLVLNASGGSNCAPQISPGGATSFTVNGEGTVRPA